jgi:hypothetical protein
MATLIAPFTPGRRQRPCHGQCAPVPLPDRHQHSAEQLSDAALSVTNSNPVIADSNGLFAGIYLGDPPTFTAYKAILKTSADVTVQTGGLRHPQQSTGGAVLGRGR